MVVDIYTTLRVSLKNEEGAFKFNANILDRSNFKIAPCKCNTTLPAEFWYSLKLTNERRVFTFIAGIPACGWLGAESGSRLRVMPQSRHEPFSLFQLIQRSYTVKWYYVLILLYLATFMIILYCCTSVVHLYISIYLLLFIFSSCYFLFCTVYSDVIDHWSYYYHFLLFCTVCDWSY